MLGRICAARLMSKRHAGNASGTSVHWILREKTVSPMLKKTWWKEPEVLTLSRCSLQRQTRSEDLYSLWKL